MSVDVSGNDWRALHRFQAFFIIMLANFLVLMACGERDRPDPKCEVRFASPDELALLGMEAAETTSFSDLPPPCTFASRRSCPLVSSADAVSANVHWLSPAAEVKRKSLCPRVLPLRRSQCKSDDCNYGCEAVRSDATRWLRLTPQCELSSPFLKSLDWDIGVPLHRHRFPVADSSEQENGVGWINCDDYCPIARTTTPGQVDIAFTHSEFQSGLPIKWTWYEEGLIYGSDACLSSFPVTYDFLYWPSVVNGNSQALTTRPNAYLPISFGYGAGRHLKEIVVVTIEYLVKIPRSVVSYRDGNSMLISIGMSRHALVAACLE